MAVKITWNSKIQKYTAVVKGNLYTSHSVSAIGAMVRKNHGKQTKLDSTALKQFNSNI